MSQYLSRSKVRIFESVLEKLGRILAEKYKIRVVFKHDVCMTDGRTIYLPVIPDNASEEFLGAIQGFLDHEVGHLLFSDFKVLKRLERKDRKKWNITQALEDTRIEHEMRKLWRGAGVNLNRCNEWALQQLKGSWSELSDFGKISQGIATIGCDGEDHWFATDVLKVDSELWDKLELIKPLIEETKSLPDSGAVVKQAQKIMDVLNEQEEDEGEGEEGQEIEAESGGFPGGEEGEPVEGEGGEGEGGEGEGEGEESQGQLGNSGHTPSGQTIPPTEPGQEPGSSGSMNPTPEELAKDEQLRSKHNMIREAAKHIMADEDRYLIYTTEDDVIEKIEGGDKVEFMTFLRESRAIVNVLSKKMRLNLLSVARDRWVPDKRRGKINPKAVFRVPIGTSKRVFRQRQFSPGFDTRCSLWIDHSGSMAGGKVNLAAKAAILFGEVLHELGIPFEVCGYSTSDWDTGESRYRKATSDEKKVFTRWGDLWVGIYKSFDEDWRHVRHRCINMHRNIKANTFDGEAVRMAAGRLIQFPEDRKILFVFNDGCPCPNVHKFIDQHTRYCKEIAEEVGKIVELFAIGINSRQVKNYYKNSVSISDIEELPKVMLQQLDSMLRKGKSLRQQAGKQVA